MNKNEALEKIKLNIEKFGYHIYLVVGGPNPRYVYTIGLKETLGSELLFAGGSFYTAKQVFSIIEAISKLLRENVRDRRFILPDLGGFTRSYLKMKYI